MAEKEMGLKKETMGALAYLLWAVTGIFFLLTNKDSFVRFHAAQSLVLTVFFVVFALIPFIGIMTPVLMFVFWLILIYKAWQGEEWEVPFIGKMSRSLLTKISK